jgi:hypothetical protein
MAASGYTPIQLYYSTTAAAVPLAANLAQGELAINITDGKLYYENNSGVVTLLASAAGSLGDVVGPASSTDNAFARFDSTTGKLLQNSTGATLSDTGAAVFTGALDVLGNSTAGSNIKLYEDTDNGTNYVAFKAPNTIAADVTWTLPAADGSSAQVLSTNGSGTLSWTTVSATPGGSTTQVQYNNAGSFAGSSNMTFDGTRLTTAAITSSGVTNSFGSATNANVANLFSGTKTGYAMLAVDSSTLSPVATGDAGIVFIQPAVGNTIQKASTGTHANFASLYVPPPTIGAGASTLTNASSIYVPSAPSGATNNYAISVGSGTTYLNGLVDISGASGGQIKFPATQNASADANTLDDYEEGTFTPTAGPGTTITGTPVLTGTYTKVGKIVTVSGYVGGTTVTYNPVGGAFINSLPFTPISNTLGVAMMQNGNNSGSCVASVQAGFSILGFASIASGAGTIFYCGTFMTS